MNMNTFFLVVVTCSLSCFVNATKYFVTNLAPNTPGGKLFDKEIGVKYALEIMPVINEIIFNVFEQKSFDERCDVPVINVYIADFQGYAFEYSRNTINISAPALYMYFYPREKSKEFYFSMLVHETTHAFQWNGNFRAPTGLTEGTADYVMVKSGHYDPSKYPKLGDGKKWDEGYGVTERFLEYCDSLLNGFTVKLNKMMRYKYDDAYWIQLLGKSVDQMWREYKLGIGLNKTTTSLVHMVQL